MNISLQQKLMKMDSATEILTSKKKIQKAIEQELGCKFIRIDPDTKDFDVFRAINEIFRHFKQSTKKTLISKISTRLLGLEFKSDSIIKLKATKCIVKKNIT